MGATAKKAGVSSRDRKLKTISRNGAFTLKEARAAGIPHATLLRMLKRGEVVRVERGLYAVPGKEPEGESGDYVIATRKFGKEVVIGGLSALSHYKLIDEVPTQIWVLVPVSVRTSDKKYRLLRTKRDLDLGTKEESGYRIATIERALIDSLIFVSKIGERVAKTAIVRALRKKLTTPKKLFKTAEELKALSNLEREWQSILAGLSQ